MFSTSDTIVAIATPPGRGGIGVVRLSGPAAATIVERLTGRSTPFEPRHATLATVRGLSDQRTWQPVDTAVITYFPAPHSYTGDAVVEVSAHGSPVVLKQIVESAVDAGARLASPGEFTLRAYLNGRIDLAQAEAVADLIDAATPLQARAAFDQLNGTLTGRIAAIHGELFDLIARLEASIDFPDEGYHFIDPGELATAIDAIGATTAALLREARAGRLVREGLHVAIVGAPNVGKSSLFNALVGASRAIVTEVPGTTRDLVSETIEIRGLRVLLTDTAGIRDTADRVEREGVSRSLGAAAAADLVLMVVDGSAPGAVTPASTSGGLLASADNALIVLNKSDIAQYSCLESGEVEIKVSALTGQGLEELQRRIAEALDVELLRERPTITNVRHIGLVQQAHDALMRAAAAARLEGAPLPEEFVLADLQLARESLEEISGRRTTDDMLTHIFARFCIGK